MRNPDFSYTLLSKTSSQLLKGGALTPHSRVLHGAVLDASMGLGGRPGLMTEMGH
jgi:hypothetical protein